MNKSARKICNSRLIVYKSKSRII